MGYRSILIPSWSLNHWVLFWDRSDSIMTDTALKLPIHWSNLPDWIFIVKEFVSLEARSSWKFTMSLAVLTTDRHVLSAWQGRITWVGSKHWLGGNMILRCCNLVVSNVHCFYYVGSRDLRWLFRMRNDHHTVIISFWQVFPTFTKNGLL